MLWSRFAQARKDAGVSLEALFQNWDVKYPSTYIRDFEKYERGEGLKLGICTETPLNPYGGRISEAERLIALADTLDVSLDYLLGRTEDRESHLSVPVEAAPVSYPGTTWSAGNPPKIGKYLVRISFGKYFDDKYEMLMWNGCKWHDGSQIHEPEYDGDILGWIPMPKEQEEI
jgi:hypothetical protein